MQKLLPAHILKFGIKAIKTIAFKLLLIARRLDAVSLLTPSEKKILSRNLQFKNKHKGQRAFVIVNGPSLKEQDISVLGNEITFVVSGFYKHEVIKKWQPKYYCIIDALFFDGKEESLAFFKNLNQSIRESIFFIPLYRGFKANTELKLLPPDKTYYVATAGLPSAKIDLTNVIQSFQSVSAFALAQAIYMGCSPIYLMGFDHDYLANQHGRDRHFYEGSAIKGAPGGIKTFAERYPYNAYLDSFVKLWKSYRSLRQIATKRGIKIYNATNGGYLDVFERTSYEEVIFKNK